MNILDEIRDTINMLNNNVTEASINIQLNALKSLIKNTTMSNENINKSIENIDISLTVSDYNVRKKLLYDVIKIYSKKN